MTSDTNHKLVQIEILENQLYEVVLYKKMDILSIQERIAEKKHGMRSHADPSINENANQTGLNQNKKVVACACFDNTSNLLLDLVEKIISIEKELETSGNPILNIWAVVNRKGGNSNFGQNFFNWFTLPITV